MNYPLISEYIEAIRFAEDNFDKLSNLRPVLDANGNPVMSNGNFAVVFKMKDIETEKVYAVKCFTREQEEREERYREIIKVLEQVKSPYFVSTQYYNKELFVDTSQSDETEFPVLVMDWVEGVPLDEYMKSIADNQFYRELLANRFQKLICWLLPQPFAHGDIKPDNIIVKEDGSIVLLDYDGMFVSALRGREALENGTPLYRHTGRKSSFFNEYIDDYAAVLLLLLLKVNAITTIDIDDYLTDNSAEFLRRLEDYLNHSVIAPLLSAYIMVSTFGRLDRGQVSCMLSDNSDYNYDKVSALQDLACKGDTVAMIELGNLYTNGTYVPKSTSKAMQWYILAKLLGNVDATCGLCKSIYNNTDFEVKNEIIQNQLRRSMVNFAYCREGERFHSDENYESAFYWFKKAADMGESTSQRILGLCYEKGDGVEKDFEKAIYWYQKAADNGNSMAKRRIGWCYKNGIGFQRDLKKAAYYFAKAAEAGESTARCNLALCYYKGEGVEKDFAKAVYWWQRAAEAGKSTAQCNLALCYCKGEGVEQDFSKAVYWYQKAAEAGNSDAQNNLADCYYKGEGVEQDFSKAVYWWQKAAEAGNSDAQFNLANCYCKGEGVEQDFSKAVYWWQKAAEAGDSDAQNNIADCYYKGEGVEQDFSKAVYWWQKAAEAGNSDAQCNLAVCYYNGLGIEKDFSKAVFWWQKAAEAGNSDAQNKLALCYCNGDGVEKDFAKAMHWYRKAAEAGNSDAQCVLALCYYNGYGVEKDITKAVHWWQRAAEAGNSRAEIALNITCKFNKIYDVVNVKDGEISHVGECNTGLYSADGKRFLCYFGTYGDDYHINEGTEFLCDDSFNDLYSECDGHYLSILYLPKSLKRIGNNVFCASISSIVCESTNFKVKERFLLSHDEKILYRYFGHDSIVQIPKGIKYIKGGAFSEKNVEKVIIPDTVMYIGDNPFAGCNNLKEIVTHGKYQVIDKTLYDNFEKRLIGCWNYKESIIFIQSGTKRIGKNAFFGLNFHYIGLPDSIEEIDETAFYRCFNIKTISIPTEQHKRLYKLIPSYIRGYVEDDGLPF